MAGFRRLLEWVDLPKVIQDSWAGLSLAATDETEVMSLDVILILAPEVYSLHCDNLNFTGTQPIFLRRKLKYTEEEKEEIHEWLEQFS